jgi:hypothetical protein
MMPIHALQYDCTQGCSLSDLTGRSRVTGTSNPLNMILVLSLGIGES